MPSEIPASTSKMNKIYQILLKKCNLISDLLAQNSEVDAGHGVQHAKDVMVHALNALACCRDDLSDRIVLNVLLAALLHDVDDHKFFKTTNCQNARDLVAKMFPTDRRIDIELIVKMIDLVSVSSNGNDIDPALPQWMYIPRFADRLESLGMIGVLRCYLYTIKVGRPLWTENTLRVVSLEEMWEKTKGMLERYVRDQKVSGSATMIDHYYDKLIHLGLNTGNDYIDRESDARMKITFDFVLEFGQTGEIDLEKWGLRGG